LALLAALDVETADEEEEAWSPPRLTTPMRVKSSLSTPWSEMEPLALLICKR
jgi:hypothetical protein